MSKYNVMKSTEKDQVKVVVYLNHKEASMFKQITREQDKSESEVGRKLIVQYIESNL